MWSEKYRSSLPSALFFMLAACSAAYAQVGAAPASASNTLQISTQLVMLDASVLERKSGNRIGDLTLEDFVLTEDNVPQKLTYISEDRLPLSIGLLFDLTDTVQPVLKPLSAGAHEVLSHLRPEDEVAVMTFSNHVDLLQSFTLDRKPVEDAIQRASEKHDRSMATFIHEAVFTATEQMEYATIPNSRRVEIWLTDGTSNYNTGVAKKMASSRGIPERIHTKAEATDRVTASGTAISVLLERSAMTDALIPFLPIMGHLGEIDHYADLTGGPVVHTSKTEVATKLAALIDALRQRYTVGYKPSAPQPKGTICHAKLELSPAFFVRHPELSRKTVEVRTRQVYVRTVGSMEAPDLKMRAPKKR